MNNPDAIERKLDGLDITRQKWAEEKASGAWEAAARRQAEREQREKGAKEEKADATLD
jgi:hypothetical protein